MKKPMRQRSNKTKHRPHITYDIETTRIEAGTPIPLYLSWSNGTETNGIAIHGFDQLHDAVIEHFLTEENTKNRFVGWNSNRFDAPLIALSLIHDESYQIEPWLTKSGNFRGMAIKSLENEKMQWQFSDGMAMFGFLGSLKQFLASFAPDQTKLSIDVLNFDATNPEHVEYAKNDSASLWFAIDNATHYLQTVTGLSPSNTIGKTAIKYFESKMPENVLVWEVPYSAAKGLRRAKRGGYVYCAGSYRGPIWKYDRNQAYAAAMREPLPSGQCIHTKTYRESYIGLYNVVMYRPTKSPVPFYIRDHTGKPHQTTGELISGWILSPEIEYLRNHGWKVEIIDGWVWTDTFTMADMVNELEYARANCDGGPKGPLGLMYKAIGNNAFGKTWEEHDGLRLVYTANPKEHYSTYRNDDPSYDNIWMYKEEPRKETYHKPQIGTFITAYQRIDLMEQAWKSANTFLYADTDCIVYTSNVTAIMDIDNSRYGAYKIEAENANYGFINKKVYYSLETHDGIHAKTSSSKGIHPNDVTLEMFEDWYNGILPIQQQTQRQNLNTSISTGNMFVDRQRTGSFLLPRLL